MWVYRIPCAPNVTPQKPWTSLDHPGQRCRNQEIFESLVLLLVIHPYDVGDRILLGDGSNIYTVQKKLGLGRRYRPG